MLAEPDLSDLDADAVLTLSGELDLLTAPMLEALLDGPVSGASLRVVDLTAVTFADSAGLAPLLRHRDRLVLHGANPLIRRTMHLLLTTPTEAPRVHPRH